MKIYISNFTNYFGKILQWILSYSFTISIYCFTADVIYLLFTASILDRAINKLRFVRIEFPHHWKLRLASYQENILIQG